MAGFKAQLRGPKYYAGINNIKRDNKGITRRERVDLCFLSKAGKTYYIWMLTCPIKRRLVMMCVCLKSFHVHDKEYLNNKQTNKQTDSGSCHELTPEIPRAACSATIYCDYYFMQPR